MSELLNRARQLRSIIESLTVNMTDNEVLSAPELMPKWDSNKDYTVGERFRYNDVVYKVLQNHSALPGWTPDTAPSLYAEILTSEDGTPKEWVQPDSTNAYMKGDRVLFQGGVYESLIDNNVWSPIGYPAGWKAV